MWPADDAVDQQAVTQAEQQAVSDQHEVFARRLRELQDAKDR